MFLKVNSGYSKSHMVTNLATWFSHVLKHSDCGSEGWGTESCREIIVNGFQLK